MKEFIRGLIPPVLLQLKHRLLPPPPTPAFGGYADAIAQCGTGYDTLKLAKVVVLKTQRQLEAPREPAVVSDMPATRLALAITKASTGGTLNCLDFGGAAGAHYLLAKQLFGDTIKMRWHVVENPHMVDLGNQTMAGDELRFFPDLASAAAAMDGPVDLLLSSGTLQYMPDPLGMLDQLCSAGARHLFLTRVALADVALNARTIVQRTMLSKNGPGPLPEGFDDEPVAYPATFPDRAGLEHKLAERYNIGLRFEEDRGAYTIGRQPISMYGYLAQLKQ